jgi:hypothetical protein
MIGEFKPIFNGDLAHLVAATMAATGLYVQRAFDVIPSSAVIVATDVASQSRLLVHVHRRDLNSDDTLVAETQARLMSASRVAIVARAPAAKHTERVSASSVGAILFANLTREQIIAKVAEWMGTVPPQRDVDAWERAYVVQDSLIAEVSSPTTQGKYPQVAAGWRRYVGVHTPSWTEAHGSGRNERAIGAYRSMPDAALAHSFEVDRASANAIPAQTLDEAIQVSPALADAIYRGRHPTILGVNMLEWLNRLEVLRIATDYSLQRSLPATVVPGFAGTVAAIPTDPRIGPLVPALFQALIFRWGGFLRIDGSDDKAAGAEFGLDAGEYARIVGLTDSALSNPGIQSWWRIVEGIRWLSVVPFPVQGLGALYRDAIDIGWEASIGSVARRYVSLRRTAALELLSRPNGLEHSETNDRMPIT